MMRKAFIGFAATVLLLVAACSSGASSGKNLKLYNDKGAWSKFFTQLGTMSKRQIGIHMQPVGYTNQEQYEAHIKAAFRTKDKPDLFTWYTGAQLGDLVSDGLVADSSAIWKKGIASGDLTKGLEKYYTIGGKQYCVPLNVSYWVMFYNKHVFDKYGLQPPKTWSDLMSIAATLKSHNVTPFYETSVLFSFVWFEQLLAGSDPKLYNDLSAGKASYTDPGVVKVMKQWKSLIDKGYMSDPGGKADPGSLLKSGKVAMEPFGTWFNTSMVQDGMKEGKDYGMFIIPNNNPALTAKPLIFESGPLCAPEQAPNLKASDRYLQWWIGEKPQAKWANSRGDVSGNPKVTIPDPALNTLSKTASTGNYLLLNRYFEATPPPILTAALDGFGGFVVHPDTYPSVLKTIQQAADQYWSSHKSGG